jgi:hypothetical protein
MGFRANLSIGARDAGIETVETDLGWWSKTRGSPCATVSPMAWNLDSYPLAEEIGDPDLFVGRRKEMARLLKWAAGTKRLTPCYRASCEDVDVTACATRRR